MDDINYVPSVGELRKKSLISLSVRLLSQILFEKDTGKQIVHLT